MNDKTKFVGFTVRNVSHMPSEYILIGKTVYRRRRRKTKVVATPLWAVPMFIMRQPSFKKEMVK